MTRRSTLVGFFLCAYAFTWAFWLPVAAASGGWLGRQVPRQPLQILGTFGPFASALLWAAVEGGAPGVRRLLGGLVIARVNPLWFGTALVLPAASWLGALGLVALFSRDAVPPEPAFEWLAIPVVFVIVLVAGGPLGEEPGWRGFALPRLRASLGRLPAGVLLGLAWAGWHLPLWFMGDPAPGYSFPLFALGAVPLSVLFTWLFEHTRGSALVALVFHAAVNTTLNFLPVDSAFPVWVVLLWVIAGAVAWRDGRTGTIASPE